MKDNSEGDIQQFKSEKLEFAETSINTNNDNNLDNPTITPEKNQKEEALIVGEGDSFTTQKLISDYYILIQHTKFFNIPYFPFGFTYNFYRPNTKLPNKVKLSEIPNPPYTLGPNAKTFILCFIPWSLIFLFFCILHCIFLKSIILKLISIFLNLLSIITGWITLIKNPGVVFNDNTIDVNEPKIYCYQCKYLYPHLKEPIKHCRKCGVCCFGRDHHCDVFGKCVAKNNTRIFMAFSLCTCILIMFNFISFALMAAK